MKRLVALLMAVGLAGVAQAEAPGQIKSEADLRPGYGALRISVRSQLQYTISMFVWFLREGGSPDNRGDLLRFERGAGVPLAGSNMIDSKPKVYRVKAGTYRLAAHVLACNTFPPPNAVCEAYLHPLPTTRYEGPSITFTVTEGSLTDAGEFVLELPAGEEVTSLKQGYEGMKTTAIRWRKIAEPLPSSWNGLKLGPPPTVEAGFQSNISCEVKPAGAKDMALYYPFKC